SPERPQHPLPQPFPYPTLFRSVVGIGSQDAHGILYSYRRMFRAVRTHILIAGGWRGDVEKDKALVLEALGAGRAFVANDDLHDADRKSTRLNSSHVKSSYAVFC